MRYILILLTVTLFSCSEKPRFELMDSGHTGVEFINRITESDSMNVMSFEGLDNGQWHSGIAVVDINNDGWKDVYLTCTAYNDSARRKNRLFINQGIKGNGQLHFKDMAETYGLADDSYSVHAAFFDYDRDGDLDLYLLNNHINDRLSGGFVHKVSDGSAPSNDDLYRNNGDGTFSNVSLVSGIVYDGFGLGLALGDVNKDGYPDIYVSNDYIFNDLLYINQGDGTFRNEIDTSPIRLNPPWAMIWQTSTMMAILRFSHWI